MSRSTILVFVAFACSTLHSVAAFGVVKNQQRRSSATTTSSLAGKRVKFQDDGGIMMELFSPIPKKNPSPESMLPRVKPASFDQEAENGIMMKEASTNKATESGGGGGGKLLGIPPQTAQAIQTKGQKFATYTSDGGIMLQAALRKPNVVKSTPKAPKAGDGVLESSPTGAQSASGRGRLIIPPKAPEDGSKPMVWKQREIDFLPAGSG
jgi:hypothetical protein